MEQQWLEGNHQMVVDAGSISTKDLLPLLVSAMPSAHYQPGWQWWTKN